MILFPNCCSNPSGNTRNIMKGTSPGFKTSISPGVMLYANASLLEVLVNNLSARRNSA